MRIFCLFLLLAAGFATNANAAAKSHGAKAVSHNSAGVTINAGGPRVGKFAADIDFKGGMPAKNNATGKVDTTGVVNPAPAAVYFTERWGDMTCTIPGLHPGASYKVRLHETEDYVTAPGERTFNVSINGVQVLKKFDILAVAKARHKAVVKEFNTKATKSGTVVILFTSLVNNAKIDGIEVLP